MADGRTTLYPMVQFKKDTWEIDEFDCASMFLLVGSEKAMLIDTGMGVGDIRGAIEMITDKPLIVVLTHGHIDHTGNAVQFPEVWMHPADRYFEIPAPADNRRKKTAIIAQRAKGSLGSPYTLFPLYPYDPDTDIVDPEDPSKLVIRDLTDGQQFDLGDRVVTVYECPGHTPGEVVLLDEKTRSLFAGDAISYNQICRCAPLPEAVKALKRLEALSDRYDGIYNGHHDFRALGAPLDDDCLPDMIALMGDAIRGTAAPCVCSNFWGDRLPLAGRKSGKAPESERAHPTEKYLRRGRCFLRLSL